MNAIKTAWSALPQTAKAVTLTIVAIGLTGVVVNEHGKWKANRWVEEFENAAQRTCAPLSVASPSEQKPGVVATGVVSADVGQLRNIEARLLTRLSSQIEDTCLRGNYHLLVMRDFYVNYYYALTMALFLGSAAAVLLFFISQKGWSASAAWQSASFIVTTTAAAAFGAFPLVYSQQNNIEQNKELYLQHRALQAEIESFAATGEPLDRTKVVAEGEVVTDAAFIRYVDRRMTELHKLPLGFDYTRLPAEYLVGVPAELKPQATERELQPTEVQQKRTP